MNFESVIWIIIVVFAIAFAGILMFAYKDPIFRTCLTTGTVSKLSDIYQHAGKIVSGEKFGSMGHISREHMSSTGGTISMGGARGVEGFADNPFPEMLQDNARIDDKYNDNLDTWTDYNAPFKLEKNCFLPPDYTNVATEYVAKPSELINRSPYLRPIIMDPVSLPFNNSGDMDKRTILFKPVSDVSEENTIFQC